MEKEPKPENKFNFNPEKFDEEVKDFFKKEDEKGVETLHEAWVIDRILKFLVEKIEKGEIKPDMSLMEAMEMLDEKKFKLLDKLGVEKEKEDEEKNEFE